MSEGDRKKVQNSQFISKLVDMLKCHPQVINWNEQGTQFMVLDRKQMQNTVLPIYFRHSNLSSFIRQLNMYDFHKLEGGLQQFRFCHNLFSRGNQSNYHFIQRKRRNRFLEIHQQEYSNKYKNIINAIDENSKFNSEVKLFFNHFIEFKFSMTKNLQKIKDDLNGILNKIKESRTKKLQFFSQEFTLQNQRITELINKSRSIDKSLEGDFSIDISNYQKNSQQQKYGMNQARVSKQNEPTPELNMINYQSKFLFPHASYYPSHSHSLYSNPMSDLYFINHISHNPSFDPSYFNQLINNSGRLFNNSYSSYNSNASKSLTQKPTVPHSYFNSNEAEDSQNSLEQQKIQQKNQQGISFGTRKIVKQQEDF